MERIETLFLAKDVRFYDELESTNDKLKSLLSAETCAEGLVVKADFQTAGRGQRDSQWHSPKSENLLMSLLLYPKFLSADKQFDLNKIVALSIYTLLDDLGIDQVKIKWPNDVYVDKKKISGILIENGLKGTKVSDSIIGIGLNVNTSNFPDSIKYKTCSLATELGRSFDVNEVLFRLVKNIEQYYLLLRAGKSKGIHQQFESHMLGFQEDRTFLLPDGSEMIGRITGLDSSGRLILHADGSEHFFRNKEIQFTF